MTTAWTFSHHATPKRNRGRNPSENLGHGIGPGLQDPNDPMQTETIAKKHEEKVAHELGDGPSLPSRARRKPSNIGFRPLESNDEASSSASSSPTHYGMPHRDSQHTTPSPPPTPSRTREELERHDRLSTIRVKIGLTPEAPILDGHDVHHHLTWSGVRVVLREPFAEFFGVFIMILFGNGSVAQVLLSGGQTSAPGGDGFGGYQSISWGWGLGVMLGIYVAGDSGGFLNPAVTFSFCLFRRLPWRRFPIYFLAQFLGGFAGSGVVYANYINPINQVNGHGIRTVPPAPGATAGIFCTYPQAFMTKPSMFFSEFVASTILMFVIFALKDDSNPGAMGKTGAGMLFPLSLFFLIFGLGACFGWETGYAINLARDFGPRVMSYILGYGHEVWSAGGYYFWIPMVAPFFGCAFGAFLYDLFIYTGPETPVNEPWFGIQRLLTGWGIRGKEKQEDIDV